MTDITTATEALGERSPRTTRSRGRRALRAALAAVVLAGIVAIAPLASGSPAGAVTTRCTPAEYYVPLSLVPGSLKAANRGCVYRQAIRGDYASIYSWRGVGTQRCLNIWRSSTEYRWMTAQYKVSGLPAWCGYYAGHFLWWY